jgi:N utilization substance protein B
MPRSKSGVRRQARECALQMLFQCDLGKQPPEHVEQTFWSHREPVDDEIRRFADDLFRVASGRQDEIDKLIEAHAQNWRLERMPAVDRNLLRAGVAELLGFPQTPHAVVINEALEIARKFSAPESVQFVNGVLDSIARELNVNRANVPSKVKS